MDRAKKIERLERELKKLRDDAKHEKEIESAEKTKQEVAARFASWEWLLVKSGHVATAKRNVQMTREWLGGKKLAAIGRDYGITGSQVKGQCGRVLRGLRKSGFVVVQEGQSDAGDDWNAIYLAALDRAEAEASNMKYTPCQVYIWVA